MKELNYFPLEYNREKFQELFAKLRSCGLGDDYIISKNGDLAVITEGTKLKAYQLDSPYNDISFYELRLNDTVLCSTTHKSSGYDFYTRTFVHTYYGLSQSLLQNASLHNFSSQPTETTFIVGNEKPTDLQMRQLSYVGIHQKDLIYLENQNKWALHLADPSFTICSSYKDEGFQKTKSNALQYKGTSIAYLTIGEGYQNFEHLTIHFDHVVKALNSPEPFQTCPISMDKDYLVGTIDGCINEIKNNFNTKTFFLNHLRDDLSKALNYQSFDSDRVLKLHDALRKNTHIVELLLPAITVTKEELIFLLGALALDNNIKSLKIFNSNLKLGANDDDEIRSMINLCSKQGKTIELSGNFYPDPKHRTLDKTYNATNTEVEVINSPTVSDIKNSTISCETRMDASLPTRHLEHQNKAEISTNKVDHHHARFFRDSFKKIIDHISHDFHARHKK